MARFRPTQRGRPFSPASAMDAVSVSYINGVIALYNESTSQLANSMLDFVKAGQRNRSSVEQAVFKMHRHLARHFQNAVVTGYEQSEIDRANPYRYELEDPSIRRFANGVMLDVLGDPALNSYDNSRLLLLNKSVLADAPQWQRLNFGAGPRGETGKPHPGWKLGAKTISFNLSLEMYGDLPNFRVPSGTKSSGIFSSLYTAYNIPDRKMHEEAGEGGALHIIPRPHKSWENPWSRRGIKAYHYLEPAMRYINEEYPKQLFSIIEQWYFASVDSIGRRKPFQWQPE